MIDKEAMEYLAELAAPTHIEHKGLNFTDRILHRIAEPEPDEIETTTLQSIVDYLTHDVDKDTPFPVKRAVIHIRGPREVVVLSECSETGERWERISANAVTARFSFGTFMDMEQFNIALQSMFAESEERAKVLSITGNVNSEKVQEHADDGVTQNVLVKAGIARVGQVAVPNPVYLAPYRTFPDIEQPTSPFVLRMRPGQREGDLPTAALFEADGTAWRLLALQAIRDYLVNALPASAIKSGSIVILA